MREILFRGFHPNENGEELILLAGKEIKGDWVCGWLTQWSDGDYQIKMGYENANVTRTVILETIGQYTGLKDKNANKIFEGDRLSLEDIGEEGYEYKEGYDFTNYASIYFDDEECGFRLKDFFEDDNSAIVNGGLKDEPLSEIIKGSEIVGNKWEKENEKESL